MLVHHHANASLVCLRQIITFVEKPVTHPNVNSSELNFEQLYGLQVKQNWMHDRASNMIARIIYIILDIGIYANLYVYIHWHI